MLPDQWPLYDSGLVTIESINKLSDTQLLDEIRKDQDISSQVSGVLADAVPISDPRPNLMDAESVIGTDHRPDSPDSESVADSVWIRSERSGDRNLILSSWLRSALQFPIWHEGRIGSPSINLPPGGGTPSTPNTSQS